MSNHAFQKETVLGVADEITPLLEQHYEEVARNKDVVKLNVDWAHYVAMEEADGCHVFTIREEGKLIGYGVFFTMNHIHYMDLKIAHNDIIFVHPDHRRSGVMSAFVGYCETQLKMLGVRKLTWSVKYEVDWSPFLLRNGYGDEEKVLSKLL